MGKKNPYAETPRLIEALPEADLRELAKAFSLARLTDGDSRRGKYCGLVMRSIESARDFLDHKPPVLIVRDSLAPVLIQRKDFRDHICNHGGGDRVTDKEELKRFGRAGAGLLIALCCEGHGS